VNPELFPFKEDPEPINYTKLQTSSIVVGLKLTPHLIKIIQIGGIN
jgi:hypothetical protein